jgi:hypothetical protein
MENIHIEKTGKTPEVLFDFENHYFEIRGVSIPEDSESFYRPLMDALTEYVYQLTHQTPVAVSEVLEDTAHETSEVESSDTEPSPETQEISEAQETSENLVALPEQILVSLKLIYFNTSTADYLVNLLRKLREIQADYPPILDNGTFNPDEAQAHLVTVEWCYEIDDDDMYDTGSHFESVLEMPFTYIAVDEII